MPVGGAGNDLTVCTYYEGATIPGTSGALSTDTLGNTENRSLPLAETAALGSSCGTSGTSDFEEFTAAYDGDGNQTTTLYPNGMTATWTYDPADEATSLTYTYSNSGGGTVSAGGPYLMSYAQTYDAFGDVATATTPESTQLFAYDPDGRLVGVGDDFETSCTTRTYTYDADSNRTAYASVPTTASGGYCPTTASLDAESTSSAMAYDANDGTGVSSPSGSDRLVSSTWTTPSGTEPPGDYAYDAYGRVTTLPGVDSGTSGGGNTSTANVTYSYNADNQVTSMTQGSTAECLTYDPNGNVDATSWYGSSSCTGTPTSSTVDHYDGDGSPAWIDNGNGTSTAYIDGLSGGNALNITVPNTGTYPTDFTGTGSTGVSQLVNLTDMRGDIDANASIASGTDAVTGYNEQSEFGLAQPGTASNQQSVAPTYGWLGAHMKAENDLSGLVVMGARVYNPVTGFFNESDPVLGGNANPYVYPADPINESDLSGDDGNPLNNLLFCLALAIGCNAEASLASDAFPSSVARQSVQTFFRDMNRDAIDGKDFETKGLKNLEDESRFGEDVGRRPDELGRDGREARGSGDGGDGAADGAADGATDGVEIGADVAEGGAEVFGADDVALILICFL